MVLLGGHALLCSPLLCSALIYASIHSLTQQPGQGGLQKFLRSSHRKRGVDAGFVCTGYFQNDYTAAVEERHGNMI